MCKNKFVCEKLEFLGFLFCNFFLIASKVQRFSKFSNENKSSKSIRNKRSETKLIEKLSFGSVKINFDRSL